MGYKIRRKSFRQKLKGPDEFISFTQRSINYVNENLKIAALVFTIGVVLIVSTGFFIKHYLSERSLFFDKMFEKTMHANTDFTSNKLDSAEESLKKIIEENDKTSLFNEIAQVGLGYTLMDKKEYDKSIEIFNELIEREDLKYPKEELYKNLSILYMTIGNNDKAAETYMKMAELFPQSTDIAAYITNSSKTGQFQHP